MKGDDVHFLSRSELDLGSIRRWKTAVAETQRLLHEHETLIETRFALCRQRLALFRSIVHSSTTFVDELPDDDL